MARILTEEGDGAPSFRPLWMLMPYLWPKGRPDLRARVFVSLLCLVLAILATTAFPVVMGQITNQLAVKPAVAVALGTSMALIGAYVLARILMQAFAQLRDGVFAKVQYHALREVGVSTWSARPAASPASSSAAPRASTRCCPSPCSASFQPCSSSSCSARSWC